MSAASIPVGQAIVALAILMLFTLVGRVHKRYSSSAQRLAVLISLYVIGMAVSNLPDPLSIRLGGFLMGGACVWMATGRSTSAELETVAVAEARQQDDRAV